MKVRGSYSCTCSGGCGVAAQSAAPAFHCTSIDPGTVFAETCAANSRSIRAATCFMAVFRGGPGCSRILPSGRCVAEVTFGTRRGAGPCWGRPSWLRYDLESPIWTHWVRFFGEHFRYIRYDGRGCGLSDREAGDLARQNWLGD